MVPGAPAVDSSSLLGAGVAEPMFRRAVARRDRRGERGGRALVYRLRIGAGGRGVLGFVRDRAGVVVAFDRRSIRVVRIVDDEGRAVGREFTDALSGVAKGL